MAFWILGGDGLASDMVIEIGWWITGEYLMNILSWTDAFYVPWLSAFVSRDLLARAGGVQTFCGFSQGQGPRVE